MNAHQYLLEQTRRQFLSKGAKGIGLAALSSLLGRENSFATGGNGFPNFAPRAKRVIYLYMSGGPSQFESFDYKPVLAERDGQELPASITDGVKLAFLQNSKLKCFGPKATFSKCGKSGQEISDLLPHLQKVADDLCIVRTLQTEQVNHDPAHTFMNTGTQIAGRPSIGSWLSYGLGSGSDSLPSFVVMRSGKDGQPISTTNWHSGFLPGKHQGVQFYSQGTPLHYIHSPHGAAGASQRATVDAVNALGKLQYGLEQDPEILTRISQYELAFKMQTSVPELADFSDEPQHVRELYGVEKPDGSFAANCLMARRMAERGVRFIQLYDIGWDHHGSVKTKMEKHCKNIDQAASALIQDLKQRGMLDDTLVVWGGEFGRTPMGQGNGRDHHTKSGALFMAGGGTAAGTTYGTTDDFGFTAAEDPFHVHDFHATLLHLLGIEHKRLTYKYQGRNFRLTDVHGHVIKKVLA